MADNLELNAGTGGSVLSTDEVTRATVVQHVQYVKLMNGTDAAIDVIPGEATNGLDVDVTRVQGTVTVDGSGVTQPVSAASLPLPTGAATAANQTTVIGHLDGVEALLTTIDADTSNLSVVGGGTEAAAIRVTIANNSTGVLSIDDNGGAITVDGTVSVSGEVDVTPGTPAANSYLPVRLTDGSAFISSTSKAVDDAAGGTDSGIPLLAIRDDSLTTLTPVDGDYVNLRVSSTGALHVTGGGGGTEYSEDVATPATIVGTATMMERDDALATLTPIEGDWAAMRCNSTGALWTAVTGTVTVDGSGVTQPVSGTVAVTNAGITTIAGAVSGTEMQVDVLTMPNVTLAAGTNTNEVVGDVAHDAAAAGNPVGVSGVAQTMDDTAPPNRVSAEGDATRLATSLDGAIFAHPHGPQVWSYHVNGSSALTDATVHASPGAGLSLYVTDIVISSGAATAINVFFEESTTTVLGPYYLEAVAGRGCAIHFGTPKKITAATALTVTSSAAIAHAIDVTGYIAPA